MAWIAGVVALLGGGGCFGESFDMGDEPADGGADSGDTGARTGTDGGLEETGDGTTSDPGSTGTPDSGTTDGEDDGSTDAAEDPTDDDGPDEDSSDDAGEDSSTGQTVLGMGDLDVGDLVITEIMWNPTCVGDNCEWFEVYNATELPVNLLDLHVQDAEYDPTDEGRITTDIILEPGGYAVLTRDADAWTYEAPPSGEYGPNPGLNNGEPDVVVILDNANNILDESPSFFGGEAGVSWTLWLATPDAVANDEPANWCFSSAETPLVGGGTERASPLEPGTDCM